MLPVETRLACMLNMGTVEYKIHLTFFLYIEVAFHREVICSFVFLRISSDLVHELFHLWPRSFKTISCLKRDSKKPFGNESGRKTYFSWLLGIMQWVLNSKVFLVGAYRGVLCGKVTEDSSMSHRASARQFKSRSAIGQGWAHQWP